jgi:heme/copper-type cytochrome/quinol oxidase subunit 2
MLKKEFYLNLVVSILAGCLPSILTTMVVIAGSSGNSEYWNGAIWIIVASIPISLVTLVIALIVFLVSVRKARASDREKTSSRSIIGKLVMWVIAVLVLYFVIAPIGVYFWMVFKVS